MTLSFAVLSEICKDKVDCSFGDSLAPAFRANRMADGGFNLETTRKVAHFVGFSELTEWVSSARSAYELSFCNAVCLLQEDFVPNVLFTMKRIVPICRALVDRGVALGFLIVLAPSLALVALLLRTNTDEPILVTDDLSAAEVTPLRTYRFRTTGRGTPAFRSIGYFLRSYSIDEIPGLLAILRGEISLAQFLRLGRNK